VAPRGEEGVVHIWDWPTLQVVTNFPLPAFPWRVGFFPDNKTLWAMHPLPESTYRTLGEAVTWTLWNTGSWEEFKVDWVKPYVDGSAMSPDGRSVAIGYETGEIEVRGFPDGKLIASMTGYPSSARELAFSPDGRKLASISPAGFVKLWDIETEQPLMELRSRFPQVTVAFTPDGKRLLVGSGGNAVQGPHVTLWDLATQRELITLRGAIAVRFFPDGNRILAEEYGRYRCHVWRAPSWEEIEPAERATQSNPLP